MRVLFVHNNFPAQYLRLHRYLLAAGGHQLVAATLDSNKQEIRIPHVRYKLHRAPGKAIHPYVAGFEGQVLTGQAAYRAFAGLRSQGFRPDVVCAHSGWGPALYAKDVWPDAKLLMLFEWFYNSHGSDVDFIAAEPVTPDTELRVRTKNASILLDLAAMDRGLCPTEWQRAQFPAHLRPLLDVIHEGIDTDVCAPDAGASLTLGDVTLGPADDVVTYVARGMEPYRGFPQFIAALSLVQQRRPGVHAIIIGMDRVAYGAERKDGKSWKQAALEEHPLDPARTHFTGLVPHSTFCRAMQVSSVHVYLTVPFVLSWSMLEAMSCGALVLASDTPPVREVIEDGRNGLLTDFFDIARLAGRIEEALDAKAALAPVRAAARQTILARYDSRDTLPAQVRLMKEVLG